MIRDDEIYGRRQDKTTLEMTKFMGGDKTRQH